jgi:hypothetical protein
MSGGVTSGGQTLAVSRCGAHQKVSLLREGGRAFREGRERGARIGPLGVRDRQVSRSSCLDGIHGSSPSPMRQACPRSDASCACGVAAIHRSCVNVAFRLSPALEARLLTATDMRNCLPGAGGGSGRAMARSFSAPSWCSIVGRRWPPKNAARTVVLCVPDGSGCSVSGQQKRPSPRWFSAPRSRPTKRLPRSRPATLDAAQGAGGDGRFGRVGPRRLPADHRAAAWDEA